MNLSEKVEFYKTNKHELTRAVLLCVFILMVIFIGFYVLTDFKSTVDNTVNNAKTALATRYWFIEKITPDEGNTTFTLDINSNIGNKRSYSNILSYGLSESGRFLAIHSVEGLYVVNLDDESKKSIKTSVDKFFGDIGEVIDWNMNDEYFSLPVVIPEPSHTEVWIYKQDGTLFSSISANIPVSDTGKSIVEPVYFSHKSNQLLLRTYKQEDLEFIQDGVNSYSAYGLPIYLNIYNLDGKMLKEFSIRDYDTTGTNVEYFWDINSNYIEYYIYTGTPPDRNKDYLFTKLAANNE